MNHVSYSSINALNMTSTIKRAAIFNFLVFGAAKSMNSHNFFQGLVDIDYRENTLVVLILCKSLSKS